ncbi:MAG: hypothetical protein K0R57_4955 [Paenibacillaceae bacterium]|nr:hypothetical protein [Paenibacillaceae bacterium]
MDMQRCDKGHFYDAERSLGCPYCGDGADQMSANVTIPLSSEPRPMQGSGDTGKTRPMDYGISGRPGVADQEKTVALIRKEKGLDPVVGWFVCVEGGDKGRDYRIRAERNFIGRSEKMDVCIRGDDTISRDAHAIVSFDARKNIFRLFQGDSKGIVYVNDEEVIHAVVLRPYDVIELGKTKLIFIPFCGEQFVWE